MVKRSSSANKKEELVPKGWMGIRVAGGVGESPERFVVPVGYLNHPLFLNLLKAAEEEFGFHHQGAITLPCRVQEFRHLQSIIDNDQSPTCTNHHHHNNNHSLYLFATAGRRCFWV